MLPDRQSVPPRRRIGPRSLPRRLLRDLTTLEADCGGRAAIVVALYHAPRSPALDLLLGLIGDPANDDQPLAYLALEGGFTSGELLAAYQQGMLALAQARSARHIHNGLPAVVADTFRVAVPHTTPCRCQGRDPACTACAGTGTIQEEGDLDRVKLALDLGRLLPKAAPMMQITNQQVLQAGSLEALQARTDALLWEEGEVVATPAPPAPEPEDDADEEYDQEEDDDNPVADDPDAPFVPPQTDPPTDDPDWKVDAAHPPLHPRGVQFGPDDPQEDTYP